MKKFWKTKEGKRILYAAGIVFAIILGRFFIFSGGEDLNDSNLSEDQNSGRIVRVESVNSLLGNKTPLPLIGRIESESEAIIRSEVPGEVARVTVRFGDSILAGQIIAELSNSSQRAEVLRAQGVLQAAQAGLQKINSGTTDNKLLVKESVRGSFTVADDAIRNKADQFIKDPESNKPEILTASSDYFVRQNAEKQRRELSIMFEAWSAQLEGLGMITNTEALLIYVLQAQDNLEKVRMFLDDMAIITAGFEPANNLSQSTIDKWRSDVSIARSSVNSSLNNLISTYNNVRSQIGSRSRGGEDILAAEAQITQAEAGLLAAQANLEKTIIRSPITGQVNQVDIKVGDFVSSFGEIAVVANNNALEIKTFISEKDRKDISIGSEVSIEGGYKGKVTRISPAVNRDTGKIELAIGVVDSDTDLTNGQSVGITIDRNKDNQDKSLDSITIPISSLKITSVDNFVFTVNSDNTLKANKVDVGSIVGDKIVIKNGLSKSMEIVIDARGLDEGDTVSIE